MIPFQANRQADRRCPAKRVVDLGDGIRVTNQRGDLSIARVGPDSSPVRDVSTRFPFTAKLTVDIDFNRVHCDAAFRRLPVEVIGEARRQGEEQELTTVHT